MATKKTAKPTTKRKGGSKIDTEKDTENNPLLHIEENSEFMITSSNFLNDPYAYTFSGYEPFDPQVPESLDFTKIDECSDLIIILVYFEYIITAKFKLRHILPVLQAGMALNDVMRGVQHRLLTQLQLNVPSFDTIMEIDVRYDHRVRYISPDMISLHKQEKQNLEEFELPI